MDYPVIPELRKLADHITEYSRLKHEYGAGGLEVILAKAEAVLKTALTEITSLEDDAGLAMQEPNDLDSIRHLRPAGPRRIWTAFDERTYADKLAGAMLARFAGCTLGAAVEFWSVEDMAAWAAYCGDTFPPLDYWSKVKDPAHIHYMHSPGMAFQRCKIAGIPTDDDVMYTIVGLLIAEIYGLDFSTEHVGEFWLKHLPMAYTAEETALDNLKAGIPAMVAADTNNPYQQWIGAQIRSDPWA